jgi:hypothetical protein
MKRLTQIVFTAALLFAAFAPAAKASFGVEEFSLGFAQQGGAPEVQAGAHPFSVTNFLRLNSVISPESGEIPDGSLGNLEVALPPGLVGRPGSTPRCLSTDFIEFDNDTKIPKCSNDSAVGVVVIKAHYEGVKVEYLSAPVYNLVPPKGVVQKFGFIALGVPVTLEFKVSEEWPYNVTVLLHDVNQTLPIIGSRLTLWGDPASPAHNSERGSCINPTDVRPTEELATTGGTCVSTAAEEALIRLPTSCSESRSVGYVAMSWDGESAAGTEPLEAISGCALLGFGPTIAAAPTTASASTASGLDFSLDVEDKGLTEPEGRSQSDIRRAEVTLPEGFVVDPSIAQGLEACTVAQLGQETVESDPGAGCPQASKIGSVEVETPLLGESLQGSLYVATPFENEFGTLLATYMVIKSAKFGILIRQPIKIVPDERTGRLSAVADDIPQLPFSHFKLHFRGGERGPLTTPSGCGSYDVAAVLTPWSGGEPVTDSQTFQITSGAGAGACPGSTPFAPGFEAGTKSPLAGAYSPFVLHLTRTSNQAPFQSIDTTLPEGLLAKLAGVTECSDAQIAAAAAKTGTNQGASEVSSPSCPASSEVGVVTVGAGSGSPFYVKGHVYLAGPYKGAPLSLEIVTPAIAGPFDLGVVAVRTALQVDPLTARITAQSDPIPTILHGLPLDVRSIALEMNKANFTLNPTSCEPKAITGSATSTFGGTLSLSQYFQASACNQLKFKPTLALSLSGQTKHAGHPALKAVLTYPKGAGYSNIARAQVNLPHSEFIDQANLNKTCTKPVLLEGKCPAKSVYGKATAWSPLLAKPLSGNVYLVGGFGFKLPALVAELNGQIRVLLAGKVDSGPNHGIRNTFEAVPDAPVEKFVLELKGGPKYSLLENSENLCARPQRAIARFTAQNGTVSQSKPLIANQCKKKGSSHKTRKKSGRKGKTKSSTHSSHKAKKTTGGSGKKK